jgi:hypothetical protein
LQTNEEARTLMKRGTPTHTKTRRLCRVLGLKRYEAVGILEMLWHLAGAERPHGDIGALTDEDIADALDWTGDASVLIAALVDCGWLDKHPKYRLVIHDWHLHADDTTKKRVQRDGNWWASEFVEDCRILSDKKRLPEPEPEPEPEPSAAADGETVDEVRATGGQMVEIYNAYPVRTGRKAALKAIAQALKEHPPDYLLAKVREYAASPAVTTQQRKYIPHPATWFNRGSYDDDPAEWQVQRHNTEQPQAKAIPMKIGRWE